ncbi:GNAT family N-acetyltransferase [Streptomyces sp. NPDC020965]|uniref:GNAT family N-acetyltransferase n=1 Tax=Streptomyces sp. NPDC020965 TaxID=3365105 RepID=UPI00378C7A0D
MYSIKKAIFGLTEEAIENDRTHVLRDCESPGFRALCATHTDGRLIGFTYGMPVAPDDWWADVIRPRLAESGHGTWLDDAFAVAELHVLPEFQRRGVGRELITALTEANGGRRSILTVIEAEYSAHGFYQSLGYRDLARGVLFPYLPETFTVMGAPRSRLRPDPSDRP